MEQTDRDSLIEAIVFETIQELYPDKMNYLQGLWNARKLIEQSGSKSKRAGHQAGFQAIGDHDENSVIQWFVVFVSTFVGSLPTLEVVPNNEDLNKSLRALGEVFGLKGKPLEDAIALTSSRFVQIMQRMTGSNRTVPPRQQKSQFWVFSWKNGRLNAPEFFSNSAPDPESYSGEVDLVIDESKGVCIGISGTFRISEFKPSEQVGLWLAIAKTGKEFTTLDIQKLLPNKIDDPGRRKYATHGRIVCKKLIGKRIIPDGKNKKYFIPPDSWSWVWILKSDSFYGSCLLSS